MYNDFRSEWLSQLGRRLNIPELAFNDAGFCELKLDENLTVSMVRPMETDDLVVFGQLPVDNLSSVLMQQMLIENRHHRTKNSPVISLSEDLASIEIHFSFTRRELETVDDVMGTIVGHLEYWVGRVNQEIT